MEKQTILLVEDDGVFRQLVSALLRSIGFNVIEAEDGQVALEILSGLDAIDLIVSDNRMPRLSGIELAAAARNLEFPTTFILMSGDLKLSLDELAEFNIDFLLPKPFNSQTLSDCIREVLSLEKDAG